MLPFQSFYKNSLTEQVLNRMHFDTHVRLIHFSLLLLCAASCLFAVIRCIYSDSYTILFMIWNLFLAYLPFMFSRLMYTGHHKLLHIFYFTLWLLFLPNAPYMITDIVHLKQIRLNEFFWFDVSFYFLFAITGVLLGLVSMLTMHRYMHQFYKRRVTWPAILVLHILCAYGVYLGRIERYNSWDLFTKPVVLFKDIINDILHPLQNEQALGFTMVGMLLLMMCYFFMAAMRCPELFFRINKSRTQL
ncbi:MAG: DUF1361 domain-containing protein [Bacteroidetes bacterium]|nr:DUF1361 domain-containing protein [Bacteroidota bacterium]